jgi:hypothetical protein
MEGLARKDDVDAWTQRAWPKANSLTPADGDRVRQAFQVRLNRPQTTADEHVRSTEPDRAAASDEARSRIDKSLLAIPLQRRLRDKPHLRFEGHAAEILALVDATPDITLAEIADHLFKYTASSITGRRLRVKTRTGIPAPCTFDRCKNASGWKRCRISQQKWAFVLLQVRRLAFRPALPV